MSRVFGPALLGTTPTLIATAATDLTIQAIWLSNPTASAVTVDFTMSIGIDDPDTRVYSALTIGIGERRKLRGPFTLAPGDAMYAFASVADKLVVMVEGLGTAEPDGTLFFDDFPGTSLDQSKWTGGVVGQPEFDRQGDLANSELDALLPSNVTVAGGTMSITARHETVQSGDREVNPPHDFIELFTYNYTSGQIQQATPPFLYGTISARWKPPGGEGFWPCFWMLGFEWQESQPYTANVGGANWPVDGWCELDIAEFFDSERDRVNCTVHYQTGGSLFLCDLPFDATTRFMVYQVEWTETALIWSVDAEDGNGFQTLRTITGAENVPAFAMYIVINMAVGGNGGGTPDPGDFPGAEVFDWVRVTQP